MAQGFSRGSKERSTRYGGFRVQSVSWHCDKLTLDVADVADATAVAVAGAEPDPVDSIEAIADVAGLARVADFSSGLAAAADEGDEGGGARPRLMPTLAQNEEANSSAAIGKSVSANSREET